MVDWRALEAGVDRRMAATFGEQVRLAFKKNGVADPGRPDTDIQAILYTAGNIPTALGNGFSTHLSAGQGVLVINRADYRGPAIAAKDLVRASDREGRHWWEISEIAARHSNLIVLSLTQK